MGLFDRFKKVKNSYVDKEVGVLTWDTSSRRVNVESRNGDLEISIKWIPDKQVNLRIISPKNLIEVMHPAILKGQIAKVPLKIDPVRFLAQEQLPNPTGVTSNANGALFLIMEKMNSRRSGRNCF